MADLSEDDPVLAELRSARPEVDDAHTNASSATAVALHTRIISSSGSVDIHMRPRTRWLAAAAAVGLVAVGVGVVGVDGPTPAAASIEDIVAATDAATRASGRATITYTDTWLDGSQLTASGDAAFAGDDVDLVFRDGELPDPLPTVDDNTIVEPGMEPPEVVASELRERVTAGDRYVSRVPLGDDAEWHTDNAADIGLGQGPGRLPLGRSPIFGTLYGGSTDGWFDVDPRRLLEVLDPAADFTVVGEEEMDGRTVTHLRASDPDALSDLDLDLGLGSLGKADVVEALDLWVDTDDVVHRIDVATTWNARSPEFLFSDIGASYNEPGSPCPAGYRPLTPAEEAEWSIGPVGATTPCLKVEDAIPVEGSYSVRFNDLGTPVTITAPADVEGPLIPDFG